MQLSNLITPDRVLVDDQINSKKRAIEVLSELLANKKLGLDHELVFNCLIGRERLGSTGLGHGVALPHGRLGYGHDAIGAFLRVANPIDFDAVDQEPVNLLFALLVPDDSTEEHLQILAQLAEMFRDQNLCRALNEAETAAEIHDIVVSWTPQTKQA